MRNFFIGISALLTGIITGWIINSTINTHSLPELQTYMDTVITYDTCFLTIAKPVDSIVVKYITRYLSPDTSARRLTGNRMSLPDDSIPVMLPIIRKVYQDSMFRAVVSGVEPSLDSLTIFPVRESILTHKICSSKPPRWTVGVTAGASLTPHGITPSVSIGVTYNLFSIR